MGLTPHENNLSTGVILLSDESKKTKGNRGVWGLFISPKEREKSLNKKGHQHFLLFWDLGSCFNEKDLR